MEKRIGTVIILIEDKLVVHRLNTIVSEHSDIVIGRQGIPILEQQSRQSVISLVLHGELDRIGSLTGKLGRLNGVNVKSALLKSTEPSDSAYGD
jgi:putative iron-only hydrogenase system regulator